MGPDNGLLAEAMTQNRAALVGPFTGATLPFKLPLPLDEADRLGEWDLQQRLQACSVELLSGLTFTAKGEAMTIGFVDLLARNLKDRPLVKLVRPTKEIFAAQLELVANYAELRESRASEILAQCQPTQVPFWASIIGMQPYKQPWTQMLAALALSMTIDVEMRLKHGFCCPRPGMLSPQIQPMVAVPGHSAWPSGHATETFMIAGLLQSLLQHANRTGGKYQEQLQRFAARVAVNRTVAGLHYPADSACGRLLGTALAEFFVARCRGDSVNEWGFDGRKFHGRHQAPMDFDPRVSMTDGSSGYYEYQPGDWQVSEAPLLAYVWKKALAEWK
jgi:hypothetical protein